MIDKGQVIYDIERCTCHVPGSCRDCSHYKDTVGCIENLMSDALALLKEQEIPEELKQQMWNALHTEEDKLEKKYVGTKDHDNWFNTYRPWLQDGFNLAIKTIADWEEGEVG